MWNLRLAHGTFAVTTSQDAAYATGRVGSSHGMPPPVRAVGELSMLVRPLVTQDQETMVVTGVVYGWYTVRSQARNARVWHVTHAECSSVHKPWTRMVKRRY